MTLANATAIAHVITRDRKVAEPFYGETLGLRRLPGDDFAAVFDIGGVPLRLTEVPGFEAGAHPVLGLHVADVAGAVDDLAAKGVKMTIYDGMGQDERGIWTAPDGVSKVAFLNDPDGNCLSLTQS